MPIYKVSAKEYFDKLPSSVKYSDKNTFTGTSENIKKCKVPITNLIKRFKLENKHIISLACGTAFEEFWFHKFGCRLTLNDLDLPNLHSEPFLKTLANNNVENKNLLNFHIEDIEKTINYYPKYKFDVLYISSFHPDEYNRGRIQNDFKNSRNVFQRFLNPITWPKNQVPYSQVILNSINLVKENGLIIFQHYAFGVNVLRNPHYIGLIKDQFKLQGVTLLEFYCYRKAAECHLIIAYKGDMKNAIKYYNQIDNRNLINIFHGRYPIEEIKNDILKVFSIEPEFNFPKINLKYRFRIWLSVIKSFFTDFLKRDEFFK